MKKLTLLAGLLICSVILYAQKVSNVDFTAIKKSLDAAPQLYQQLLDRFVKSDTTLTKDDYNTLYYGQCYQKDYSPYGSDADNLEKFRKHYDAEEYAKALPYAMKIIEKKPLDMQMTFKALVCNHYLKDEENKSKMGNRYNNIMLSIFESGDGKTAATAFVVMCISDEYELMANLQVTNTSQSLVGDCDLMKLKENDLGLDKLYFNVSKPLESMMNMFKEK